MLCSIKYKVTVKDDTGEKLKLSVSFFSSIDHQVCTLSGFISSNIY